MSRFILTAAITVIVAITGAGRAAADIAQHESLDLAVARSDLVVLGEVAELTSKEIGDGTVWTRVTIKVAEVIKGEKVKEVTILVWEVAPGAASAPWRTKRAELLLCLNRSVGRVPAQSPLQADYMIRSGNETWAINLSVPRIEGPYFGLKFQQFTDPNHLREAARQATRADAAKPGARLAFMPDEPPVHFPREFLYPDTPQVRAAARQLGITLREIK
jgi:hypothetical protein